MNEEELALSDEEEYPETESLLGNPVREAMTAVREAIDKCESVDNDYLQGLIIEVYGLLSALEDFDG